MPGHNTATNLRNANSVLADPGAGETIHVDRNPCVVEVATVAAENRTLADPDRSGLLVTIGLKTDGDDLTISAETAINQNGDDTAVMADAGDALTLVSVAKGSNHVWRVLANDGAALSS